MPTSKSNAKLPGQTIHAQMLNPDGETVQISYNLISVVDRGTFGVVYTAKIARQTLAVKKVVQDPQYRNREVDILRTLSHPNIVTLHYFYYERTGTDKYLYMFMDYIPTNISKIISRNTSTTLKLTPISIKLYMYQMFCAIHYLHSKSILHRDIKPSNLLVDPGLLVLKLCDFGNAKKVTKDEPSVDYICSRFYRAPELIFGAIIYSSGVDIWSAGCVLAECFLKGPLFNGFDSGDQLVKIIRVLGTPTADELLAMKQRKDTLLLGNFKRVELNSVADFGDNSDVLSLLESIFQYSPDLRPTAMDIRRSEYFGVLFDGNRSVRGWPILERAD